MTRIKTSCPDCGDVELGVHDVTAICLEGEPHGNYRFRCPACSMIALRPAGPRAIDLLVAAGCRWTTWRLPAELHEHPGPEVPCFERDDIVVWHRLIADEEAFSEAIGGLA